MKFSPRALFLVGLLLFGLGCRFYHLAWDGLAQFHPDERFCNDVAGKIQWGWPFFDSRLAPLNPSNSPGVHYVYGQFPLFVQKLAVLFLPHTDPLLVGRFLSAIFDCLTVWLCFLIARRIFSLEHALLAASLVALSAIHVQHAHFFVTDTFAATFVTASFWALLRFLQKQQKRDAALCGAFWGLALACKISSLLLAPVVFLGLWMALKKRAPQSVPASKTNSDGEETRIETKKSRRDFRALWPWTRALLLCLGATIICFRLANPMAFRGEGLLGFFDLRPETRYVLEVQKQLAITRGDVDVPFNVQWIGTPKWFFSLLQLGNWAYGWGFLLSGLAGLGWLIRKREPALVLAGLAVLVLLGVQGAQFSKFTRYYLPMTPFVALLAAFFWREMALRRPFWHWGALGVAGSTALWCWAVAGIWSRPHTLRQASSWIVQNVLPLTVVANETAWDLALPIGWIETGNGSLHTLSLDSYGNDTPEKREAILKTLDKAQWIFQSSGRSWQNIPRWPEKWPMTTRFYTALFAGQLGFERAREFTSYPRLGPFEFPDDGAEEALSVYDHPRVILWRKRADFSLQEARRQLQSVALPQPRGWVPREAKSR